MNYLFMTNGKGVQKEGVLLDLWREMTVREGMK
jgi:hypothetical protein